MLSQRATEADDDQSRIQLNSSQRSISLQHSGNIAILFTQFGPYHHARVKALQAELPAIVIPAQIAAASRTYAWTDTRQACDGLQTLCQGAEEDAAPISVFFAARRFFKQHDIRTVFLPSYSPAHVFALYAAAVVCRCRRIMMNESHAATERATGWKRWIKKTIVKNFHSALVGGSPQKRHFESLGLPGEKIFTGYDAIDNDFFATAADNARVNHVTRRDELGLPDRYFLNLGRFVEKKDLETLIRAFAKFRTQSSEPVDLVLVGSGEQGSSLKDLVRSLNLRVRESSADVVDLVKDPNKRDHNEIGSLARSTTDGEPSVYFMGFQQIEDNPSYYALADAFVLPSAWEEWGLVVNEAMACELPVVVSRVVGCAEDLVDDGGNGFLFDPGDVDALTECLVRLAGNQKLRQSMSVASTNIIANWGCDRFADGARKAIAATSH